MYIFIEIDEEKISFLYSLEHKKVYDLLIINVILIIICLNHLNKYILIQV